MVKVGRFCFCFLGVVLCVLIVFCRAAMRSSILLSWVLSIFSVSVWRICVLFFWIAVLVRRGWVFCCCFLSFWWMMVSVGRWSESGGDSVPDVIGASMFVRMGSRRGCLVAWVYACWCDDCGEQVVFEECCEEVVLWCECK